MTGIERLFGVVRELGRFSFCYDLYETLGNIADQIECERACDADTIENVRLIVGGVVDEMEHHVSGVEDAEDSPVARWACELREAMKSDTSDERDAQNPSCASTAEAPDVTSEAPKVTRDPAEDVSMSAYDLLPQEDREAIAWVREHGGLDAVKRHWECLSYYADPVPRAYAEKRIAKRQRQIDESHAALRRRNERIAELERRLSEAVSAQLASDAALYDMRRELRDVCEANGVEPGEDPLRAMERHVENLTAVVENLRLMLNASAMPGGIKWPRWDDGKLLTYDDAPDDAIGIFLALDGSCWATMTDVPDDWHETGERVKRSAKVLDADGAEIRVGDTLYYVDGREQKVNTVARLTDGFVQFGRINEAGYVTYCEGACIPSDQLTHRAPVLAADGKPLCEGERVWCIHGGGPYVVDDMNPVTGSVGVTCNTHDGKLEWGFYAGELTHEDPLETPRPLTHERPDSWERLEEDATKLSPYYYARDVMGLDTDKMPPKESRRIDMMRDLVRRAKKLAERDR